MEIRRSESIAALAEALAKAQLEFLPIAKDTNNPYYNKKYADLAALINATRPALGKHGLSVIQVPRVIQGRAVELSTMLLHSSGEFLAQDLVLPAFQTLKDDDGGVRGERFDAQTIGIAITYGRRYSYGSILSLAAEDDDDGNGISNGRPTNGAAKQNGNGHKPAASISPTITDVEQNAFWSACKKSGKNRDEVGEYLMALHIRGTDQMLKTDFANALQWALGAA
jgi:hypothetical protein